MNKYVGDKTHKINEKETRHNSQSNSQISMIATTFIFFLCMITHNLNAKVVRYNFDINLKEVNFTGKKRKAIAIAGKIPGPTIEATVGDTLEITFNNKMDKETSIHWHGVLLPNSQDGVPYLTTPPIAPHSSFTFRYKVTHSGTYWYHSHTGLQEQLGVYGSLVFHPKNGEIHKTKRDYVVVLSEWNDDSPDRVLANLKKDGDYYALKKGSVQSWLGVIANGPKAIKNRIKSSLTRMGAMDLSDIGYDIFLANGKNTSNLTAKKGEKVRIRLINAGASSYFNVEFAGGPMTIVAADGMDVEPIKVKRLRIAIAETYDIIVPINENNLYELRATSEDGTGYSSIFIGNGDKKYAPDIPKPNLYLMGMGAMNMDMGSDMKMNNMNHTNHMSNMNMGKKQENKHKNKSTKIIEYMDNYKSLRSVKNTELSAHNKKIREIKLDLTGNMEKYVWSFNNKTLIEADKIMIKKGEVVRIIMKNRTMMHHPIHLHGHFFRILNGQGEKSPLKHTVNIAPMETVTIEFDANEEKDWFFHCHNLYHVRAGMARVVSYENTTTASKSTITKLDPDHWYYKANISVLSNMGSGMLRTSNSRNSFEIEYDHNYNRTYDIEAIYARNINRYTDIYAGFNIARDSDDGKNEQLGIVGVRLVLPLLIESNLQLNSEGKVKLSLGSELQLSDRLKLNWSWDTNRSYRFDFFYEITKETLIAASYDSDFKWGVGVQLRI